jgi:hypothetical protein
MLPLAVDMIAAAGGSTSRATRHIPFEIRAAQ